MLRLLVPEDPRHARLEHPRCSLSSIPSDLSTSGFVVGWLLRLCGRYWSHSRGVSLAFFGFYRGSPAWRVSGVPCSSRLLVFWHLSDVLVLLPIIWPDVKVRRPIRLPSPSLWLSAVDGPDVSQRQKRRRGQYYFSNDNSSSILPVVIDLSCTLSIKVHYAC